ncbi:MAG: hypothetical protein ACI9EW_000809 [Cellvibrionaceae bacterium]|jgi:uncharacterized protein (DUF427 family)
MKATWNGAVIAESNHTVVVEGNHYFPADSVNQKWFAKSERTTGCPWKGTASYYNLADGNGAEAKNAAWYYPAPKDAAKNIKDHVAFYSVVNVTE